MEEPMNHFEPPRFRATIAGDRLTVTEWNPSLCSHGPMQDFLRQREEDGVAIADLTEIRDDNGRELIVNFVAAGGDLGHAEELITRWATSVGHRRIWFPSAVVDVDRTGTSGTSAVRCPTCRQTWIDGQPEFWLLVREMGVFPTSCPVCGGLLPQWSPVEHEDRAHGSSCDEEAADTAGQEAAG
jgi:hypothetical protein